MAVLAQLAQLAPLKAIRYKELSAASSGKILRERKWWP